MERQHSRVERRYSVTSRRSSRHLSPKNSEVSILVVDDAAEIRKVTRRFLDKLGFEVSTAENGERALEVLDQGFDIILTDLNMPGRVDGNELTRRVRTAGSADVLIMTAYPDLDSAIQALKDGAYDYLIKPFNQEVLRAAVERCIHKRGLSKELAHEKALRAELDKAYSELSKMEKVREIFGNFATREVAELALSHPEDFWKRGERRVVSILFADVRGFTPFASRVRPEEVVARLNDIFRVLVEEVQSEGGILNKFMGDGIMAFFGAPVQNDAHLVAGARAALQIRQRVEDLAVPTGAEGQERFRIGLGLNTGEVVAGCLGTKERTEYSVIGHAVNVAARLVEVAEPGEILVGPETAQLLAPSFELKEFGEMRLRGVCELVQVCSLLGARDAPDVTSKGK